MSVLNRYGRRWLAAAPVAAIAAVVVPATQASAAPSPSLVTTTTSTPVTVANWAMNDGADGVMSIDFGQDASVLGPAAKGLVVAVLGEQGLGVPDFAGWEFTVAGNSIAGRGHVSAEGLDRMTSFLVAPGIAATADGESTDAGAAQAAAGAAPARAKAGAKESRDYFKAVGGMLDSFRGGASLSDSAGWLTRSSRRIDQLPAARVDPDLLVWGTDVSSKLREAAAILSAGQQKVRARSATRSIDSPA